MNQTKNVPELRFPEFAYKLEETKFGDVFTFFSTNSFSRALLNYEEGEVKNIHYGDIHTKFKTNFDITKEEVPYLNSDVSLTKISEESYCKLGDLVIADASEDYKDIGKTIEIRNLDNQKLVAGLHTYIARDTKEATSIGFMGYMMQTQNIRTQMMTMATGISVLGISKNNLSKLKLFLPLKEEQSKIAGFLTSVDKKIDLLTKKKSLLEKYKKEVMQKIFNQEIRFKDDDGNDYPEWEEKKLGDITTINQGLQINISERFLEQVENSYFYITNEFLKEGSKNTYYIKNPPDSVLCNVDDILMTRTGNTGKVVTNVKGAFHNNFFRIKYDKTIYKDFLVYFLNLYTTQCKILSLAGTSTIPDLNHSDFYKIKIKVPEYNEQTKIANFITSIDKKINQINFELENLQIWKKGLLQQMFI